MAPSPERLSIDVEAQSKGPVIVLSEPSRSPRTAERDASFASANFTKEDLEALCSPAIPIEDAVQTLASNVYVGLSSAEVQARLLRFGPNELVKQKKMPLWLLFLSQFANLIIIILLAAASLSMAVGEVVEGAAVFIIVLITVGVATITEYSSGNALAALASLTNPHCHALRDGNLQVVRTADLVPGDIVQLSPGDLVPADVRIIEASHAKVNEMILTGESADVHKKAIVTAAENADKLTMINVAYGSTSVVDGKMKCIVVLTGMSTRVGSIAALLNGASQEGAEGQGVEHHDASPEGRYTRSFSDAVNIMDIDTPVAHVEEADEADRDSVGSDEEEEDASLIHDKKASVIAKISKRIQSLQAKRTPLQSELHRLGIIMTSFAIIGAALVVIIGLFRGFRDPNNDKNAPWLQSLMLGVSMAVSAIPEGLPLVVVICLALGTKAMAAKNALIKRLPAVETLGSASVICSDKTGTLTSGKMTVRNVWCMQHQYKISGEGYDPTHGHITEGTDPIAIDVRNASANHVGLALTMSVASLCNDSEITLEDKRWKPLGTSTEAALVCCTEKFGIKTQAYRKKHSRVLTVPFSSSIKMMATVHSLDDKSDPVFNFLSGEKALPPQLVCAKGAPTAVLAKCSRIVDGKESVPLTEEIAKAVEIAADELSSQGLRVLAMSCKGVSRLPSVIEDDVEGLLSAEEMLNAAVTDMVFCGLICMMDPPRAGVRQAVRRATQGGIRTVMVTGDYLKTAIAIAEMVSILDPRMDSSESAIDCGKLRPNGKYLSPREIDAITWHTFVFSRARPEDKIQIVRSFQRQGFVCAMTGDGVNDAPALRQADIGVAMGLAGSEVAKAASDMILTDDKFISIVDAVELGRTIYINLRKFVMYLIGTNWAQIIAILCSVLIGLPSPLEPLQILFVNLITDSMPAIALSIEAPESDVMKERPRKKNERILSGMIVVGIFSHALILVLLMLAAFLLGLWWELGFVFVAHMYDDDNELVDVCSRLNDEGTRDHIVDDDCVKEGLTIARTMVFLTIAFAESLRPLTARSFENTMFEDLNKNKAMLYAIAFSIFFSLFVVFVPGVNYIFHMKPPHWYEWLLVVVFVIISVTADELLKMKFRSSREEKRRWDKLFTRVGMVGMELRNVRSHLTRIEDSVNGNNDVV